MKKHWMWMLSGCGLPLLYLGCILVMLMAGHEETIWFFNSIPHRLDIPPVMRMNVPVWEADMGLVEMFIISWLAGAILSAVHNFSIRPGDPPH
jgi:hypothetical protein